MTELKDGEVLQGAEAGKINDPEFADVVPRKFVCARCKDTFMITGEKRFYCSACSKVIGILPADKVRKGAEAK